MSLRVSGLVSDPSYHCCCALACFLLAEQATPQKGDQVTVEPLFETKWENKMDKMRAKYQAYKHKEKCMVEEIYAGKELFLGGLKELISIAKTRHGYSEEAVAAVTEARDWQVVAREALKEACSGKTLVYMDISVASEKPERVVMELFSDLCPRTSNNFKALCTGEMGTSDSGVDLSYLGSPFHRVVNDSWVQGGDIVTGKGDNGESIYGATFEDETMEVTFPEAGVLAMANDGPHSNSSQFFVSLAPLQWMERKAVGFGHVLKGMGAFYRMTNLELLNERPIKDCVVSSCGLAKPEDLVG